MALTQDLGRFVAGLTFDKLPPALSTRANPSSRARAALASPTAKSGTARSRLSRANARTPLALVHSTACTPARSGAGPSR